MALPTLLLRLEAQGQILSLLGVPHLQPDSTDP